MHPASRPPNRWSSRLLALAPRRPGRDRRRPPQAWPQLLGHDLHQGPGAAVLVGPGPLLESTTTNTRLPLARDCAGMLGLVAPHDHGEERRLLLPRPDTATRNIARAIPASVLAAARGRRSGCQRSSRSARSWSALSVAWPGGLPCPWNGDGGHRGMPRDHQGQAMSQRSRPRRSTAERARLRCRLGWRSACGWGSGMPAPSGRSLHPGRGGRTRLPPRGPLAGPFQVATANACVRMGQVQ